MNANDITNSYDPLRILLSVFGISGRVSRQLYATVGFGLMLVKYVVEATAIYLLTNLTFNPVVFLVPSYVLREPYLS